MTASNRSVRRMVLESLARVRGQSYAELLEEIGDADDFVIDSKQGQTVAISVETRLGREGMIRAEDQRPEWLSSLNALLGMLQHRIEETEAVPAKATT